MRAQLGAALRAIAVFTVLTGLVYPLVVTAVAQVGFADRANGSLLERDGVVIGSRLIGQPFDGDEWFHPRPSAAGSGYDGSASGASNLGPTNDSLLALVRARVADYRARNGLTSRDAVPVDAVTASASGLDPHISLANARLQAPRVAQARDLDLREVLRLVDEHTEDPVLGFLGERVVHVLALNLALDAAG